MKRTITIPLLVVSSAALAVGAALFLSPDTHRAQIEEAASVTTTTPATLSFQTNVSDISIKTNAPRYVSGNYIRGTVLNPLPTIVYLTANRLGCSALHAQKLENGFWRSLREWPCGPGAIAVDAIDAQYRLSGE